MPSSNVSSFAVTTGVLFAMKVTVLSVLVEAALSLFAASLAAFAGMDAVTVPFALMPLTATL